MTRHARQRLKIVMVMIFCLLFQQVALAAYLCPQEALPPETSAMAEHCAEMGMAQQQDNPALCQKHCSPDHATAAEAVNLSVPPLALPPLIMAVLYAQPVSHVPSGPAYRSPDRTRRHGCVSAVF